MLIKKLEKIQRIDDRIARRVFMSKKVDRDEVVVVVAEKEREREEETSEEPEITGDKKTSKNKIVTGHDQKKKSGLHVFKEKIRWQRGAQSSDGCFSCGERWEFK